MKNQIVNILILNWNGWEDTIECLNSLMAIKYKEFNILVLDNHSSNDSFDRISLWAKSKENKFTFYSEKRLNIKRIITNPSQNLVLLKSKTNLGFAGGNNYLIMWGNIELPSNLILLLNNDTTVDKMFLTILVKELSTSPLIGAVGPLICNYFSKNTVDSSGLILDDRGGAIDCNIFPQSESKQVFGISGCCVLYKTRIVNEIIQKWGYFFDDLFFLYYEDVDLAWRLNFSGYRSIIKRKSIIYHKVSASSKRFSIFKSFYLMRNRYFILIKYFPLKNIISMFSNILKKNLDYVLKILFVNQNSNKHIRSVKKRYPIISLLGLFVKVHASVIYNFPTYLIKRNKFVKTKLVDLKKFQKVYAIYKKNN